MKIANILPVNKIGPEMPRQDYEMYLTHVILEHPEKFEFLAKDRENGIKSYKILDNSACELGEALDFELVKKAAHIIGANELVLPDKPMKGDSLTKTLEYLAELPKMFPFKLMGVAQGESFNEVFQCALQLLSIPRINTIGIPKWYCSYESTNGLGRHQLTTNLVVAMHNLKFKKDIHWLGAGIGLREFIGPACEIVRSVDTGYFAALATKEWEGSSVARERPKELKIDLFHMDVDMERFNKYLEQQKALVM